MKVLLYILLGFLSHKCIGTYYSYIWWKNEEICRFHDTKNIVSKQIDCIYTKLGYKNYIIYLLLYPQYTFQKWQMKD